MAPLVVRNDHLRYHALIGTGGIGAGSFFALNGNHTLGREESRTGRFLDTRDYAKLHIIAHYVQTLMGSEFKVLPIGRVGADEPGQQLSDEMGSTGIDLRYVCALDDAQTMNCVCLLYPDGSGGNLTVSDSACTRVDTAAIRAAQPDFAAFEGDGIALAVPEVPLDARMELLELGTRHRFFRAASFTSEEIRTGLDSAVLGKIDLLAVNQDEAAALGDLSCKQPAAQLAERAVEALFHIQPAIFVIVTAGVDGSWAWDGKLMTQSPAFQVKTTSAAGAGDAFFAGVLAGLASGLSLAEAQQLGTLTGAVSVTSPHTINPDVDRMSLAAFAQERQVVLTDGVRQLLSLGPAPTEGQEGG